MIFSDWRRLTENEVRMAKQVFSDSIDFHRIKIYRGIPLLPNANTAIAPNGNIYFPRKHCPEDFTQAGIAYKIWLIHELTHVWQHQHSHKVWLSGLFIMLKGGYRKRKAYAYPIPLPHINQLNIEQQADLIAHYFAATFLPKNIYTPQQPIFQTALADFLHNPHDKNLCPRYLSAKKQHFKKQSEQISYNEQPDTSSKRSQTMPWNIPILLTWMRVLLIPVFTILFYVPNTWIQPQTVNWTAAIIFALAAITDWFDGFLARRWKQTSDFGAFLDPVADKLMVAVALLLLVSLGRTYAIFAMIIIGREITISALREWMAQMGKRGSVAVATIGKFKTTAQMIAIFLLLIGTDKYNDPFYLIGNILMFIASVLTIWSMCYYLKMAWKEFK